MPSHLSFRRKCHRYSAKPPFITLIRSFRRTLALAALILPLTACQGIVGTSTPAQVRIIDASPDAPPLDIYQGPAPLAYNLALGTITSYVPIAPGAYPVLADTAGTRQHLISAPATFLPGSQYTVLLGNYSNSLHELILKDQTQPAVFGQADLRLVHQSTRAGALDLYLVPIGSTILTAHPLLIGFAFNANSGYLHLPTGTYTLIALPTGTTPTVSTPTSYTGSAILYDSGSAHTIVLIDQPLDTTPGIQAIIANDFDSTST